MFSPCAQSCRVSNPANRRDFLAQSAFGAGALALNTLLAREAGAAGPTAAGGLLAPKQPHFPPRAERVIFLFMTGGPSHLETFDPKPELKKLDGQQLPKSFNVAGLSLQNLDAATSKLLASPFAFRKCGESGLEISELFPHLAEHADRLAVIRSCYHESFVHGPAITQMTTGSLILGHPSVGAWVTYGLGSASDNLPAYMVLTDGGFRGGSAMYQSGFLPAVYQGTILHAEGAPIQNLTSPNILSGAPQRHMLDQIQAWNLQYANSRPNDSRLDARIANYELAYRMQTAAPDLIDVNDESAATLTAYGIGSDATTRFGRMCLLARRMVERGVRFVTLINNDWDGHTECAKNHEVNAKRIDRPIAALIGDLEQRGLLDSTLIVWTGEFGRTPIMQGNLGRDHSPYGFSSWLAGAGVRGGQAIGATDEFGFRAIEDKVHVHDLHATMLSLLGLDHTRLTYLFAGREQRLTDVGGYNDLAARLAGA